MLIKQGKTTETNIVELIKQADSNEQLVVLNFDGFRKYADGKGKSGIVIIATGPRADQLRELLPEVLT